MRPQWWWERRGFSILDSLHHCLHPKDHCRERYNKMSQCLLKCITEYGRTQEIIGLQYVGFGSACKFQGWQQRDKRRIKKIKSHLLDYLEALEGTKIFFFRDTSHLLYLIWHCHMLFSSAFHRWCKWSDSRSAEIYESALLFFFFFISFKGGNCRDWHTVYTKSLIMNLIVCIIRMTFVQM